MSLEFENLQKIYHDQKVYDEAKQKIRILCGTNKPISRTTWSNWMKGKSMPTPIQKQIINNILLEFSL